MHLPHTLNTNILSPKNAVFRYGSFGKNEEKKGFGQLRTKKDFFVYADRTIVFKMILGSLQRHLISYIP